MINNLKKHIGKQLRDLKVLRYHLKQLNFSKKNQKKQIIICFNGVIPHGGLVDRLKGIISFYDVSKTLDYNFYIQFTNPFLLNTFLEPNKVDWQINTSNVKYNPFNTRIINCINNFNFNPLEVIKNSNASTFIVYANIDYLKKNLSNLSEDEVNSRWRNHFNTLFKTTTTLNNALNTIKDEKYNSFHTRFTSIMGDFSDSTTAKISEIEREKLLLNLKKYVNELMSQSVIPFYGFSDSSIFLNYISKTTETKILEGQPFHMENYNGGSTLEAHLKTMLDFFTIANSETVYFLKADKMYNSAFSKYAAIIGDKPFKTISVL
ncbi:hypothetical protein [Aurantibacter sp.]|uniref:hypothetical protein n=1 Tax=Aurantibacter sp. TaxID=2807103 RepID=UPI0035C7F8DA